LSAIAAGGVGPRNFDTPMRFAKPALIINAASGSTEDIREPARIIAARYGLDLRAEYLEPSEISEAVDAIMADGCDLLISFGGDGTSRASGETAIAHDIPFVPLPGGTMNMLPRLLYSTDSWDHALVQALESGERWQARGEMNGHAFFCGGFVGKPARFNAVREAMRDGDVAGAAGKLRALVEDIALDDVLSYGPADTPRAGTANLINIQMPGMGQRAVAGGGMELTGIDVDGVIDLATLGVAAIGGDFREADAARTFVVREGAIHYDKAPDVLLDGEPLEMDAPLNIVLVEDGVRVLAPALPDGKTIK